MTYSILKNELNPDFSKKCKISFNTESTPTMATTESHYSLRWNNHQNHILTAFDALLQAETLVDVTLVCAETSVRAHKVVLSACSPFFQRIFSENPCKHPVIVLKDFSGWEVQAIVDFMYKGEISVGREQLQSLIKAAESLQIRGLDDIGTSTSTNLHHTQQKEIGQNQHHHHHHHHSNQSPAPSSSPNDYERNFYHNARFPVPGMTMRTTPTERSSPFSPLPGNQHNYDSLSQIKLPHMGQLSFPESLIPSSQQRNDCQSPIPRRKQARPRRRSGELCTAQDLSTTLSNLVAQKQPQSPPDGEETAENLCVKKLVHPKDEKKDIEQQSKSPETTGSPELDLSLTGGKDFNTSPPLGLQPLLRDGHLPFPPMPNVSALAMSQPHNNLFSLDASLGLFPPGLEGCRNPLLEMADPRTNESSLFVKKKMGRPKGQHSAPRGGPPRSWTNAELTEALQHVWNKKMTTSQASRIFGIPYNSLLMYVRGKYGKSLKLEQLRKDCIAAPGSQIDMMSVSGNNNNNSLKNSDREHDVLQPNTRPGSTEEMPSSRETTPQQMFNPFSPNFYPDFGAGFPIPVSMIHLLPQSEKNREHFRQQIEDDGKNDRVKDEPQDVFMSSSISHEDRRELVQNGQD
nr:protein jim lovell isoform X1 [Onthophagus taurus]